VEAESSGAADGEHARVGSRTHAASRRVSFRAAAGASGWRRAALRGGTEVERDVRTHVASDRVSGGKVTVASGTPLGGKITAAVALASAAAEDSSSSGGGGGVDDAVDVPPRTTKSRYRARRTSRERRWERPMEAPGGPQQGPAGAGAARGEFTLPPLPLPSSPSLGWSEMRAAERQDSPSEGLFPSSLTPRSPLSRAGTADAGPGANLTGLSFKGALAKISGGVSESDDDDDDDDDRDGGAGVADRDGVRLNGDEDGNPGGVQIQVRSAKAPARQQVLRGKELTRRIKQLGDARKLDKVLALVAASPIPETPNGRRITLGAVIGACCKCGDLERALKLLRQLDGPGGVGAGAPAYTALIQVSPDSELHPPSLNPLLSLPSCLTPKLQRVDAKKSVTPKL